MDFVCKYFLIFITISFLGWIVDMISAAIHARKVVNRGFLIGPICPIYGVSSIIFYFLFNGIASKPVLLFLSSVIVFAMIEYLVSFIMEKMFHTRWWDYSGRFLNINGRICLSNAIGFGFGGIILIYVIFPLLVGFFENVPIAIVYTVSVVILVIFSVDIYLSNSLAVKYRNIVKNRKKDSTDDILNFSRTEFLKVESYRRKRLMAAFSGMKVAKKSTSRSKKSKKLGTQKREKK